ncbi:universal stress protein [Pediococcus stilesii]|uniref:Universal stress protein UspA-like nucleotide-binding protein n=1 Tax=Pediococcus stilesii TaxID=331679 RepID=A0A0R2L552_9LACO|nr:universal stress protein [Pediococcus stilesii]KRN94604.1 universal stress protein UspA-like nucleotide-binding protein [Pediococcus stilesii]
MEYKKILFGYDGSPESMAAFDKAIEIAQRNSAKLVIANVVKRQHANTESVSLGFGVAETDVDIKETLRSREEKLEVLKHQAEEKDLSDVEIALKIGNPKSVLSFDLPKEYGIDLIVLGATGLGKVAQVFIGSTASYVVENSAADVIIVKN